MQALRIVPLFGLLFMLAVASSPALTSGKVVAHIPFDFMVGGTTLPAGDYVLRAGSNPSILFIRNRDDYSSAIVLSIAVEDGAKLGETELVFRRHGNEYVLSQVWSGDSTGRELRKTRMERWLTMSGENEPQVVTILAQSF